jgi:transposase
MTRTVQVQGEHRVLHMAMELSGQSWKLGFCDGGPKMREKTVPAGAFTTLLSAVSWAKERLGLPQDCPVHSCYEAGRDGFWIHRELQTLGIDNVVIDPASVEVDRRARRKKTDRIDVRKLLGHLVRHERGEQVWSVVRIPSESEEDARRPHRELIRLKKERTAHRNRLRSLLALHGVKIRLTKGGLAELEQVRRDGGRELPPALHRELLRERDRLAQVESQIAEVEKSQLAEALSRGDAVGAKITALLMLAGIGQVGALMLVYELFGWRVFRNGREVGALLGATPTPFQSGGLSREQGISKAGIGRLRALMVELSWQWLRYQQRSALSQWFNRKFARGGPRLRRIGIVALARRLTIALWRYVEHGQLPEGAVLKPGF